jgi:Reverse transcriptase (RNA-dependent DNA polymerase).
MADMEIMLHISKLVGNYEIQLKRTKGPRQGCCLSPILFSIYLENSLYHWKKSCQGIGVPIKENKCLFSPNYEDD